MYEFHPYFTNDGSVGLYNSDYNDIYHSADGALTEAYEKFIYPLNIDKLLSKDNIKILDICYGIGYNSKSFLNLVLEKIKFSKKNSKNLFIKNNSIETIYTNNISKKVEQKKSETNNIYNSTIYTDNIFEKIFIKAIDNDKVLSFISPFVKTGEKKFNNKNLNFEYKQIDKYLLKPKINKAKKIDKLINYLIFQKIDENNPDFEHSNELFEILSNKAYKKYFDANLLSLYQKFYFKGKDSYLIKRSLSFLHNIYYQYISNWYKRNLKIYNLDAVNFELEIGDARQVIINDKFIYDVIFLDAFTPAKCPCLWSYDFFKLLYNHLDNDGIILTYTSSAAVRSAMMEAGFYIGKIYNKSTDKFIETIAVKNKTLIKHELTDEELGLLKTTAGIFYKDKNLTGLNEAINEARNLEIKNSDRISSSQYFKHCKEKK